MLSEFWGFEEDSGYAFGCQCVFVLIEGDGGDSFNVQTKLVLVFGQEGSHEAAQAPVEVEGHFVLFGQVGNVLDWVDDAVRVVGVGAVEGDSVFVDKLFHVLYVCFEVLVEPGLPDFDVEVGSSLVDGSMDGAGCHSISIVILHVGSFFGG